MKRSIVVLIAFVTLIAFTVPAIYADDDPPPVPTEPTTPAPGDPPPPEPPPT